MLFDGWELHKIDTFLRVVFFQHASADSNAEKQYSEQVIFFLW